jgi:hypothetical protein
MVTNSVTFEEPIQNRDPIAARRLMQTPRARALGVLRYLAWGNGFRRFRAARRFSLVRGRATGVRWETWGLRPEPGKPRRNSQNLCSTTLSDLTHLLHRGRGSGFEPMPPAPGTIHRLSAAPANAPVRQPTALSARWSAEPNEKRGPFTVSESPACHRIRHSR